MAKNRAELLLHPVRLRIVMVMAAEAMTTVELMDRLSDVPQATLYRHVAALHEAGILEVADERQVRGGTERTYRLVDGSAYVGPEEAKTITNDQHLTGFVAFVGALMDAMGRYLADPNSKPGEDAMGYRQIPLWLSDAELQAMAHELSAVVVRYAANQPTPERSRTTLSTILIPDTVTEAD